MASGRCNSMRRLRVAGATLMVAGLTTGMPGSTETVAAVTPQMRELSKVEYDYGTNIAFLPGNSLVTGARAWDGRSEDAGIRVLNVAQPSSPRLAAFAQCASIDSIVGALDNIVVQALDHPDATDATPCTGEGNTGVRIWDVSNREEPREVSFVATEHGVHTLTVVRDAKLVYASGQHPMPIIDISDPKNPKIDYVNMAGTPTGNPRYPTMQDESGQHPTSPGCHEIGLDLGRNRAYCAGITETQIWDITDRRLPKVISVIRNPLISHHHSAEVRPNGTTLVLTDESFISAGGHSACTAEGGPVGALWFYDITDERNPRLKGWWSPPDSMPEAEMCGAHNFGFFEDRDWLAAAWMERGVYVIDFSNADHVKLIAHSRPPRVSFWDAKVHKGHIYANSASPHRVTGSAGVSGTGSRPDLEGGGGLYVFSLS